MAAPVAVRAVPGTRTLVALLIAAGGLIVASRSAVAGEPGPDTLGFRLETGATADVTSEIYYEDTFTDSTFLGRRRVDTPEARYAGVIVATVNGTRGDRRAVYQMQNELSLGDKVQRNGFSLNWRDEMAPDWRLAVTPALEWRHDRTFDRDQREWRGSLRGRVRRSFDDGARAAELGAAGDFARTSGAGSEFMLDRNAGRAWIALDHVGLLGDEWRLGYRLATRVFPDSSERDHFEHGWEGRLRHVTGAGHALTLELDGQRRQTHRVVTTTRDNFWQEEGRAEADLRAADHWGVRIQLEGEALQYDLQDSTVFFDYQVTRARLAARYERDGRWTLAFGPRGELLTNRLNPGEAYREFGGALEFERIGTSALWNVTPAAGWRAYDESPAGGLAVSLHTSYAFYGLDAFVDQPLVDRLRLRTLASLRVEAHADPSENAASVYVSAQLLWSAR
jgi:hypothetical protein